MRVNWKLWNGKKYTKDQSNLCCGCFKCVVYNCLFHLKTFVLYGLRVVRYENSEHALALALATVD